MKVGINSGIKSSLRRTYNKMTSLLTTRSKFHEIDTWESSINWEQIIHTGCISSKNHARGTMATGSMPDYYTTQRIVHIKAKPEYWTAPKNGRGRAVKCDKDTPGAVHHPEKPAHDEIWKDWSEHYYIDQLFGDGKGAGTRQVQDIVLESLKDPETRGRVLLEAASIDGHKSHPAGFYYKLGFRHTCDDGNIELAKWLKEGGKRENAPWCDGNMYLPQENIMHCLNYGNTAYSIKDRLLIKGYMLRNKILFAMDSLRKPAIN